VLKLETEIATAVAHALKLKLLDNISQKIELGGTRNPAAFDAYLRGSQLDYTIRDESDFPSVIAAYTEAIRLDPKFALAFADRSIDLTEYTGDAATGAAIHSSREAPSTFPWDRSSLNFSMSLSKNFGGNRP
jgi:adenylate cyclase